MSQDPTADRELEATTQQLQIVTDAMGVAVTRCTRDLRYAWVSRAYCEWIGRGARELVGRPILEVLGPDAFRALEPHFAKVLAGETVRYQQPIAFAGIGERWIEATYTPTRAPDGSIDGWVAVVVDIEERKRTERALAETDRRKNEFLAVLAHELRNPLAAIANAAEILRDGPPDAALDRHARELIARQVSTMVRLIDDLLDMSRLTHGTLELRRAPIPLQTVIERAIETTRPALAETGQTLAVRLPDAPVPLDGDLVRLTQVFANLLTNAAKFGPRGGHVELEAELDGAEVLVTVRDDGPGIPPELESRLFEMFGSAEAKLAHAGRGLGIGLSIVRRLVEMHGGTVSAYNRRRGSAFVVRLPLAADAQPATAATVPTSRAADGPSRPRPSVLVVDDNEDAAVSLAQLLQIRGCDARSVCDPHAALAEAARHLPDLVLLDLGLPRLDGYEVARLIRAGAGERAPRFVAITGWGRDQDRERSRAEGFALHLVKPIDGDDLDRVLALFAESPLP